MAGPKITILGDASGATAAFDEAIQGARKLENQTDAVSAGFGRSRIAGVRLKATAGSFGGIAAGLVVAGQASRELSQQLEVTGAAASTTSGRFSNAGSQLLTGNFIGGLKALATEAQASDKGLEFLTQSSIAAGNQAQLDGLKADAASVGWGKLSEQLRGVSLAASAVVAELAAAGVQAAIGGAAARTGLSVAAADAAVFGERTGRFGRGPGAVAEGNSRAGGAVPDPLAGLSQQLKTAIAASRAGGNTKNQIAQLQRGRSALQRQLKQEGLKDEDREKIYSGVAAINAEIESLGKHTQKKVAAIKEAIFKAIPDSLKSEELSARLSGSTAALKAVLKREAALVRGKLTGTLKSSDRIELQQALLSIQDELSGINKSAADALKETAAKLKQAALDKLDLFKSGRDNSRDLADAQQELKLANQIGGPQGIKTATRDLEDAKLERKRLGLQGLTYKPALGPGAAAGSVVININGTNLNEGQLTRAVLTALEKRRKKTSPQKGGRNPGQRPF